MTGNLDENEERRNKLVSTPTSTEYSHTEVLLYLLAAGTVPGPPTPPNDDEAERTVWVRCHPSIFKDVLAALKLGSSLTLQDYKTNPNYANKAFTIELLELWDQLNVFEIMGPKASQVIRGVLSPVMDGKNDELKEACSSLCME